MNEICPYCGEPHHFSVQFVNTMVNYDLPWNPMRVEQRIGRLDRYGQESPLIHIVAFSVKDTIEEPTRMLIEV